MKALVARFSNDALSPHTVFSIKLCQVIFAFMLDLAKHIPFNFCILLLNWKLFQRRQLKPL